MIVKAESLTLGIVSVVMWRIFSTVEGYHQYYREFSVLWSDAISTVRDTISIVEDIQYCGEYHQHCEGIPSAVWRDTIQ